MFIREELLNQSLLFAPGFSCPPLGDSAAYRSYVADHLPLESAHLFGFHPNAEIGVLTSKTDSIFFSILQLQVEVVLQSEGKAVSEKDVQSYLNLMLSRLPEGYDAARLDPKALPFTPFISVAVNECKRMNLLLSEIRSSLHGLLQALKVRAESELILLIFLLDTFSPFLLYVSPLN